MSRDHPLAVHVLYRLGVGGLENGVVNLVNRAQDWRHTIVALEDVDTCFARRMTRPDVQIVALHKGPGHGTRVLGRLHGLLREWRPEVVHTRNLGTLDAAIAAWTARVPVRIHGEHGWDRGDEQGTSRRHRLIRKVYSPFVHHYVALSRHIETYLKSQVGIAADRISQIHNGVDTDRFRPAVGGRAPIEGSPFNESRYWVVGTVGRMQTVKDQPNLARAFVEALRGRADAAARLRLVVVGDGPLRAETEQILRDAGLLEHAWFAGERADVPELLRGLDCFALPSRTEGISNTILEAAASGLPIVATRVGGNTEIVEENVTARLVPPSDPRALADALLGFAADPVTARRMGKAGRELVAQRFGLDRMVERYLSLYKQLLARRGGKQRLPESTAAGRN